MNDDVQAASERLRWWASDPGTWARDRDVLVVLSEVERLRAEREALHAARASHPRCDVYNEDEPITCGWKSTVQDIDAVLYRHDRPAS